MWLCEALRRAVRAFGVGGVCVPSAALRGFVRCAAFCGAVWGAVRGGAWCAALRVLWRCARPVAGCGGRVVHPVAGDLCGAVVRVGVSASVPGSAGVSACHASQGVTPCGSASVALICDPVRVCRAWGRA